MAYGNTVAGDEVDAVDADDAKFLGHRAGERARPVHERRIARVASRRKNVPAVPVSCGPEGAIADQLACHANRHRAPAGRDKHHRSGRPIHQLLQVAATRQALSARPWLCGARPLKPTASRAMCFGFRLRARPQDVALRRTAEALAEAVEADLVPRLH